MPSFIKDLMMKELEKQFEANPYAFISNFQGLSVADISDFRRTVEKVSTRSFVVKHSMAKKIFAARNVGGAEKFLNSQVLVTFGAVDPQKISKALVDFSKAQKKLIPAGVIFENNVYGDDFVKRLASMPSRHELLTQVAIRVKSPITGFVMTLSQLMRGIVVALNEIKKQKEAAPQPA